MLHIQEIKIISHVFTEQHNTVDNSRKRTLLTGFQKYIHAWAEVLIRQPRPMLSLNYLQPSYFRTYFSTFVSIAEHLHCVF